MLHLLVLKQFLAENRRFCWMCSATQVPLAALLCKLDLLLALAVAHAVFLSARVVAMHAGDALFMVRRRQVFRRQRLAAGVAERVLAFLQTDGG